MRPGVPGLTEGGADLPDEEALPKSELRFAPGAAERIFGGGVASADDLAAVERIYDALAALARKPSQAHRRRLRELFREGNVRARIDPLRDRLTAESPPNAVELYPELRELFLRSGYRDEVKYAMALMSGFGRPEDADLFRVDRPPRGVHDVRRGRARDRHRRSARASGSGCCAHVSGWGRTELSELILREPRSEDVRERARPRRARRTGMRSSSRAAAASTSCSSAQTSMPSCSRAPARSSIRWSGTGTPRTC